MNYLAKWNALAREANRLGWTLLWNGPNGGFKARSRTTGRTIEASSEAQLIESIKEATETATEP